MTRMRRLWVPVLVGLLVSAVLGVGGGGAVAAEPRTVTASIMIPTAAFTPQNDDADYMNYGDDMVVWTGYANFTASVSFPVPVVNIKRITLYGSDNTGTAQVCASLYRSRPPAGSADLAGSVCTVESTDSPQTIYTTAISPRQVNTAFHGPYLNVLVSGPGVLFHGVKITYSYDTGA